MGVTAVIGIGLPASGKTENLTALANDTGALYVCPDDMQRASERHVSMDSLWQEVHTLIQQTLRSGRSVVVNATNAKMEDRRQLVREIYGWADEIIGIYFTTPVEVCLERMRERGKRVKEASMRSMAHSLTSNPPRLADGFDQLIEITA